VTLARRLGATRWRKNCAPSRDHGGFWAWRRAHGGHRDGASACSRGLGTIHRQEHATRKCAPNCSNADVRLSFSSPIAR